LRRGLGLFVHAACATVFLLSAHALGGCKAPEFYFEVEESSPEAPGSRLVEPVRLGTLQRYRSATRPRYDAILAALSERKHTLVNVVGAYDPLTQGEVDYLLETKISLIGRPHGLHNFWVAWVFGPIFGTPGWIGLYYDYEVQTSVSLTRPGREAPLFQTTILDLYGLSYTSDEYAWLIYMFDLGFLSGIWSCSDELTDPTELEPVEAGFLDHAALKEHYLRRVVNAIENAIACDRERAAGDSSGSE
jgi:hypothetical protein